MVFEPEAAVSEEVYRKAATHWAFKPLVESSPPESQGSQNPIDAYVATRIVEKGLKPCTVADKPILARRLSFDLLGLPPGFDAVESFGKDSRPDAISRLVDKLLASPRFGERWGRHWLDVARYADTRGYLTGGASRSYPFAYVYRDWVVNAFNSGVPFDFFVRNQLAADLVVESSNHQDLAALGFLTVGPRFINRRHLILDDRIDVISRGLMGFTVGCARCHDHFYDPIPQEDYYSLYGVLDLSIEPKKLPVVGEPDQSSPEYIEYLKKMEALERAVKDFLFSKWNHVRSEKGLFAYLKVAKDGYDLPDDRFDALAAKRILFPKLAIRWRSYLRKKQISSKRNFSIWNAYAKVSADSFPQVTKRILANPSKHLPLLLSHLEKQAPKDFDDILSIYAKEFALALDSSSGDRSGKELKRLVSSPDFPVAFDFSKVSSLFDTLAGNKLNGLRAKIVKHQAEHPGSPPRAMVLKDSKSTRNPRVFERGSPDKPGREVPRRFLTAIAPGEERQLYSNGSGRLELAESILHPENPLTSRVYVNRVWDVLFGKGLVGTTSDFGLRGESPSHPLLLDYLARNFVSQDWDVKRLIREIVTSATYLQGTAPAPPADQENNYLSVMNRRRVDFEAMRDGMLFVSGDLDLEAGGKAVELEGKQPNFRRTLYGFVERQNLPDLFRTFDFANPNIHSPGRAETTVPQQALFAINDPFVLARAESLALQARSSQAQDLLAENTPSNSVQFLFRRILARNPSRDELNESLSFLGASPSNESITDLAQSLLVSNEFFFID